MNKVLNSGCKIPLPTIYDITFCVLGKCHQLIRGHYNMSVDQQQITPRGPPYHGQVSPSPAGPEG